jgi:hypothetical protein
MKSVRPRNVLLAGRNQEPLSDARIKSASQTFLGLDNHVNARYDPELPTVFHVVAGGGEPYGEIRFGRDIFPGPNVVDPNAALGLSGACAHELAHYHRWHDLLAINDPQLEHIDEALTSLQAALRYGEILNAHDIRQLINDAIHRLQLYAQQFAGQQQGPAQQQPPQGA